MKYLSVFKKRFEFALKQKRINYFTGFWLLALLNRFNRVTKINRYVRFYLHGCVKLLNLSFTVRKQIVGFSLVIYLSLSGI